MVQQGKAAEAVAIYRKLFAAEESTMCRIAALTGLVAAQKEQSISTVISAVADRDAGVRRVAASTLRYVPGAEAAQAIVGSLFAQGEDVHVMLLAVLADRRDAAALPAILKAAESASPAVRLAALAALAALSDASVVPMLAGRAATTKDPAEQQAARNSLNNLRGDAVNAAIARQLGDGQPGVRVEAARSLAARGAVDQKAALFRAAEDSQALAIDKDPNTRWDTGASMSGGEWFRIELDEERLITGLVLDTRGSGGDYPRGYEVYVSPSSLGDGQRVAKGEGKGPVTEITFDKPVRGRAVKIVQTGQAPGAFWSIHELTIQSQPVEKK